ncbi:aspartic proteinase CDR1-like [Canna indica]|uniref:Aspartic proteinase CDR1-like n=1 Tax=Canna indica TaxID=4628 RepID=A0AAQ3KFQ9_9LILI|nr:aspartic proteinase CDR1-like [Canna indica]
MGIDWRYTVMGIDWRYTVMGFSVSQTIVAMALLSFSLALLAIAFPLHSVAAGEGLSIKLIHCDSPKSPLYDPSTTHFDRVIAAAHRAQE